VDSLHSLFKDYCYLKIRGAANNISSQKQEALVNELLNSPFRSVVQAWSILDFYDYKHLYAEGYEKYFGWKDSSISAKRILEIVHPDDQKAFGKLYYLVLEGLLAMPIPVKGIGQFCISYRVITGEGKTVQVIETSNIIASDPVKNIPLICLSQMNKVQDSPADKKVTYYFQIKDEDNSVAIMSEYLKNYDSAINVFSENEIQIARLMKEGLTSQQIADKVFLSKNTVDKYRKNMLKKTDTANSPQLITHLMGINLI
jgi:DNA-binding CsgD family transcriptional regulator